MKFSDKDRERFSKFLSSPDDKGCILWLGYCLPNGYGQFMMRGTVLYAHRVAFELSGKKIPPRYEIMHTCDTPACCNAEHLRSGTHLDNMNDMRIKGRSNGGSHGLPAGVHLVLSGKYQAQIRRWGEQIYLGRYATPEEAEESIKEFDARRQER